ncbi:Uncharacterized protein GBIM_06908 [Gryllus bimaculatus]|nr:Uncharacterized protein GBIM_06908 [Gryllus bimaculatus]
MLLASALTRARRVRQASLYSGLLRDHVELQRSHHVIELRLKMSESKARSAAARLQQLQSEAQELRELNELQEFRILELEESHDRWCADVVGWLLRNRCDGCVVMVSFAVLEKMIDDMCDGNNVLVYVSVVVVGVVVSVGLVWHRGGVDAFGGCDWKCYGNDMPVRCGWREVWWYESVCLTWLVVWAQRTPRSPGGGSHDTRDVCTDTENEDVSDSGVLSLPTSEDVASDSDAGGTHDKLQSLTILFQDLLKSHSDYSTHLLPKLSSRPPFSHFPHLTDLPSHALLEHDRHLTDEESLAKQLKNAECLQESGIFEGDSVSDFCSRGTQTEGDLIPSHAELKAEIKKLKQYRECIKQQKDEGGGVSATELAVCRDQLRRLEDKVLVYESSGDAQVRLLAERLQRELSLAAQVEQLGEKVARLQADNARLEEQRCELEEAENDTRLRCQKMEHKLQTLIDKKLELHLRLKEERRASAALRGKQAEGERWRREASTLKAALSRCEARNSELEGREADLRQHLHLLHTCWPAVLLWQVWSALCASCAPRCLQLPPGALPSRSPEAGWAAAAAAASPKRSPLRARAIEVEMALRLPAPFLRPSRSPSPAGSPGAAWARAWARPSSEDVFEARTRRPQCREPEAGGARGGDASRAARCRQRARHPDRDTSATWSS